VGMLSGALALDEPLGWQQWLAMALSQPLVGIAPLVLLPLAVLAIRHFAVRQGRALNLQLKETARLQALLCAVLVFCLLWG